MLTGYRTLLRVTIGNSGPAGGVPAGPLVLRLSLVRRIPMNLFTSADVLALETENRLVRR
jgi:hypothetical protein